MVFRWFIGFMWAPMVMLATVWLCISGINKTLCRVIIITIFALILIISSIVNIGYENLTKCWKNSAEWGKECKPFAAFQKQNSMQQI